MHTFEEGYAFFEKNAGAFSGATASDKYVSSINAEIDNLMNDLNSFKGFHTDVSALKGDVAEFWHSGTHNIDATIKDIKVRTTVDRSHDFASADIVSSDGTKYGLKYYANGDASAKAQSESIFQRYSEYKTEAIKSGREADSFELFLNKRGYDDSNVMNDPIYMGQVRIIPKDQMQQAVEWLERKIAKESSIRPDQVKRYQDTLDNLRDKISSSKGSESIPLTKAEAEELARLSKEGMFNPEDFGLTTEELIKYRYIMEQAFKAGLTAATISMVLRVAPELYKALEYLIRTGEIDEEQFKRVGFAALSGSAEGFVRGSISAAITTACKAGLWGEALKSVNPSVVATVTVIMIDVMKNSYSVATGKMTQSELVDSLIRNIYISTCSLVLGSVVQGIMVELPVFGFMLGSFVGSMVGSFAYTMSYKTYISFCISTGFTMFGVVEQDYRLPEDVLKLVGIEIFDYEKFSYNEFTPVQFETAKFSANSFKANSIDIVFLRRGVIGVNQIGYS